MRQKLRVESVENNAIIMTAVAEDDEKAAKDKNKQAFSETPSGRLHFHMDNKEMAKNIKPGDMYYADFTKAPSAEERDKNLAGKSTDNVPGPGTGTKEQDKK